MPADGGVATRQLLQDSGDVDGLKNDVNAFFILSSAYLVFFMQCGFAMLSAGAVRSKNAKNIILKILMDASLGALGWYLTGYAFALGDDTKTLENGDVVNDGNGFIGTRFFAFNDLPRERFAEWMFQYGFAATAATIVSGAVAERTKFQSYMIYAVVLIMLVYPCVVHWVWSAAGWASAYRSTGDRLFDSGVVDVAGCGPVHMIGGLAGLAGAITVGPRLGRFDAKGTPRDMPGHNAAIAILGVFILWFGWYGFNPGSVGSITGARSGLAATCAITTTLSAASGTMGTLVVSMLVTYLQDGHVVWDLIATANGTLAGLVGITACCGVVKSWAAIIIGLVAGAVYVGASRLVAHVMKVDDPLDAIAVHAFCGAYGLIVTGLFADEEEMELFYEEQRPEYGLFMGGGGRLLAAQLVFVLVVGGWVLALMFPTFYLLKMANLLRVDAEEEQAGLDVSHHGGSAYADADAEMKVEANKALADYVPRDEFELLRQELVLLRERVSAPGKAHEDA